MQIIILGAGQVGASLAETLARENHDVTVVDIKPDSLTMLQASFDIRTICGHAAHPHIIEQAGASQADMLIAATSYDEINMLACQIGHSLYQIPTKIARIRSPHYLSHPELYCNKSIPIDVRINSEQLITQHLLNLVYHPGALQVLDFAEGNVQLISMQTDQQSQLVGQAIENLPHFLPQIKSRTAAIYRNNRSIPLSGTTTIQANDEVFLVAERKNINTILFSLGREAKYYNRIIIAGCGNIGGSLASKLENEFHVKIVCHNLNHIQRWHEKLRQTTLLHGEACDQNLLIDENIENTDLFFALTNDDEANIMSCLLAKKLGAKRVIALINRIEYVDLIHDSSIDIAFSPHQITVGAILKHVRHADTVNVYSLRRGAAEAIEIIAHGDRSTSHVIGRKISEINLPPDTHIGAIYRKGKVLISNKNITIEPEDHVILFVMNKQYIKSVERLFQVSAIYF